ncbi:SDR family NAD(P)-dependent oxidoreductase [Nitratireductor indicus]|uniref:SDR family NAD(P)-dependent oxidoreductase n=1 Tax=Nitratireductor indicus TaxID=721133 RepID=UPI002876673D|nr:SDR family oxidoreductase [Nitratireductor indicus]MDS1138741.1 SDR family oxidoreductase [Nitratireductor indicus]
MAPIHAEGIAAEALVLDIGGIHAVRSALGEMEAFGIVFNSAGLARHSAALETTEQSYDAVMGVNLRAAYFLSIETVRAMIDVRRPGSVIHVSSQMGHVGGFDRGVYYASKHWLEGMVKAMAIEWGSHGIRINTIAPTFVDTPLGQATLQNSERRAWIEDKIKLGRFAKIEDTMGAIAWLSSDAAAMVTGTSILIDGGWTAG